MTLFKDVGETFACIAPKTKEHLQVYCSIVLNMRFPYPNCCKDHDSVLDAIWDTYSESEDLSIWYAMRGSGKTQTLSVLGYLESAFKEACGICILGGSLEQSTKAVGYLDHIWSLPGVPRHLLSTGSVAGRGYKLTNGSWVTALAASSKSVRGPHPQKLRLDECDEMDEKIYDASLGQPKSNYGIKDNIVISSTLHYPFGLMSKIIDERHEKGARLYQWCVEEAKKPFGFWDVEELKRRKRQITNAMWEAEYLLRRPKLGETIFDFMSVDNAFRRGIKIKFDAKVSVEAGIDWGHTCTVLTIVQDYKEFITAPEAWSWEYKELNDRCKEIAELCIEKKISIIYCDSNPKDSYITLKKILKNKRIPTQVIPIAFNQWKGIGINVIRYYLEKNLINIGDKTLQDKMKKYHYKNADQGIIEKKDDHHPDSLIAWAASRWRILECVEQKK